MEYKKPEVTAVSLNVKGSLINRKWGSWFKYVFKR